VSDLAIDHVDVNGEPCRVWRKGSGPAVGYLPGFGGLPKWIPFLDKLAEHFEVVAPSIPGFPGADGFRTLDSHVDWVVAVREVLDGAGLSDGAMLIGSGPGGAFAAEAAAIWPASVSRLVLIAPWGIYDKTTPMADPWATLPTTVGAMVTAHAETWDEMKAMPEGANSVEFPIEQTRVLEATARAFWPLGDSGLAKRLHRITCPTLLLWGKEDQVLAPAHAENFTSRLGNGAKVTVVPDAGHIAELDQPDAVATAIIDFLS
jgi:abhydrolase domain-containing protein 6